VQIFHRNSKVFTLKENKIVINIRFLKEMFYRHQFKPEFLGLFINPFYFARKGLYQNIRKYSFYIKGKTLDIGCGQKPYKDLFLYTDYVGLEIESAKNSSQKKADFYYDGHKFPFQDDIFNSVLVNQVFEHIFNPNEFLDEIHRVLQIGGILLMTVPFVWDEHEQPFDYARYSSFGLIHLLHSHGFEILEHTKSIDDIRVIFQLISGYIYKKLFTKSQSINLVLTFFLISPINIFGEILNFILPKNSDLYLDNIVVAKKV
jgi:SAM-dependent methyltransferase